MTRVYQPRFLADGADNPKYKHRTRPSGPPKLSKFARAEFIAWDGEGVTDARSKRHRYVMLMNSVERLTTVDASGIPTRDCLDVLCTVGEENRRAIHVVFGGSYDVNMMLGDCTYEQVHRIWSGAWTPICGGRYSVSYRARKSFSIRRVFKKSDTDKSGSSIVLWDVFGFFQSTFVDAMLKYIGTSTTLDEIKARKAQRSTFRMKDVDDIKAYCAKECRALVSLMDTLHANLDMAGLPISRWDGAGACAASLLRRERTHEHKRHRDDTPDDVLRAAQHAYAGGRTEMVRYGHAPNTRIYHYDINSAYPAAMRACPSLAHGEWTRAPARGALPARDAFALVHVRWAFDDAPMYPFFWRSHDTSIYYPQRGQGWCWVPELYAATDAIKAKLLRGRIDILDAWRWDGTSDEKPFNWIDPLFTLRAQWKRDGIGAEKALKLAINSLYGKTAQHVGGTRDEPPRYHQLEWAGYITSRTRAMVYNACTVATKKNGRVPRIIMVATDGVYALDPLDVPIGADLGQWEATPHTGITVAQSGVYWTDDGDKEKTFCRGFDKGSLDRQKILRAWKHGQRTYDASLTRFVTMGTGLASRDAFQQRWRQWRTCPRTLKLSPDGTKRFTAEPWTTKRNPSCALVMTGAAIPASQIAGQIESAKYPLPWDDNAHVRDGELVDGASARIVEQEAFDAWV